MTSAFAMPSHHTLPPALHNDHNDIPSMSYPFKHECSINVSNQKRTDKM